MKFTAKWVCLQLEMAGGFSKGPYGSGKPFG